MQEAKLPPSSTLYLDDQSARLMGLRTKRTGYTDKTQSPGQKKSRPAKPSTSVTSPSRPAFLERKGPSTHKYTRQGLEVDKASPEPSNAQQRSKVCIKLPIVSSGARAYSGLSKVQPPNNLLNTPPESITRLISDSSFEDLLDNDQLVHSKLALGSVEHLSSKSKSTLLSESPRKNKGDFYPVITNKTSRAMVKHIQIAWQTSLEHKCSRGDENAETTLLHQSNLDASTFNFHTYKISTEQLFTRGERNPNRGYKAHTQERINGISKALVTTKSCQQLEVSELDANVRKSRPLSAPDNSCGRHELCDNIYPLAHKDKEQNYSSSINTHTADRSTRRPHTALNKDQHTIDSHTKFLKEPRRRAIRELMGSLPKVPKIIRSPSETISASTQQTSNTTPQLHVLIAGQKVPVVYSADNAPFVSKLRNNFSYTDLEFGFNNPTLDTSLGKSIKVDANVHQQVQKKTNEIDIHQQLQRSPQLQPKQLISPEQSPFRQRFDDKEIQTRRRNILINNVCSMPLDASPTKNLFYSPINFSHIESEEDYMYGYNTTNNLSVNQKDINKASTLEKRDKVLRNDILKGIADSLKDLETLQQTRKSNKPLTKIQPNSITIDTQHTKLEDMTKLSPPLSPQLPRSPKKNTIGYTNIDRTLKLRDLATHSTELDLGDKQDNRRHTTINSVPSALPQTAKSSRFFTFNV